LETHAFARRQVGGAVAATAVGCMVAVQSLVNGELADRSGGGLVGGAQAALISFAIGLVVLCGMVLVWRAGRQGIASVARALRLRRLRPWQLIGGAFGAYLVLAQSITVPVIGVALFTVSIVAGQSLSSVLVDRAGLGPAGRQAVTIGRAVGATVSVVAVGLTVLSRTGGPGELAGAALALVVLPFLAGASSAVQQAVNGRVAVVGGSIVATWVNFIVGAVLLTIAWLVVRQTMAPAEALPALGGETWWLYGGGVLGVVFIAMSAVLVRVLGVLVFGLCNVAGQVMGSLVLDVLAGHGVEALTIVGACLTLTGVVAAGLSTRRRATARMTTTEPVEAVPES